jgi:hypothetical protein
MNAPLDIDRPALPAISRVSDLVRVIAQEIAQRLPPGWQVDRRAPAGPDSRRPDALLEIVAPGGERGLLVVEAKLALEPHGVRTALQQVMAVDAVGPAAPMVASRFLSPTSREILKRAGVNYADATGNVWIVLERPGLFVKTQGAQSNPWREERELRSLKGRTASRIVRALCDFDVPFGVRELAGRAGASAGTTVRTLDFLAREALILRDEARRVVDVELAALVARWSEDFRFTRQNAIRLCFEPRRLSSLTDRLREATTSYAITGSFAANVLAPYAEARLLAVYVEDPEAMIEQLGVREPRGQSNVWLARPPDDLPFERTWTRDGLRYAAPSQIACDLFDMPGRSPAEAEELLRFMSANSAAWRAD